MAMDSLGIPYVIIPADIDEKSIRHENPFHQVQRIAKAKAEKISNDYKDAIVIAADSFFVINGKRFEKPQTLVEAKKMLLEEAGKKGEFITGLCYVDKNKNVDFTTSVSVSFQMREFSEEEIDRYIKNFPVLNWAGAISAHHAEGAAKFATVNGSLTAMIYGLPIEHVVTCLKKSGVL